MPSHAAMVSPEDARRQLRRLGIAWAAPQAGLLPSSPGLPSSEHGPVRVQKVEAPSPMNETMLDWRQRIESFTWTYAAFLSRRGQQVLTSSACPTARAFAWRGRVGADAGDGLAILSRHVRFLLEHPSAPVAWGFVNELEGLEAETQWAWREVVATAKRVPIGVQCRECEGVYEIEVQDKPSEGSDAERKRAFGAKGPVAVCSLDDSHKMGARDLTR